MSKNTPSYENIFIENLLRFCLDKRGIAWQPAPRNGPIENDVMQFNHHIGHAVMHTSNMFQAREQTYIESIWNRILQLKEHVKFLHLYSKIYEVAFIIHHKSNEIKTTYVFLAVMVGVSIRCAKNEKQHFIQDFVSIIPDVLNSRVPNGFCRDFNLFNLYAHDQVLEGNLGE